MSDSKIYIGNTPIENIDKVVKGEFVSVDAEDFFKIGNYDSMRPFFMTIVSDSNHWMFISSNGGISTGRKNADNALFPYYTDDKITDSAETTGSKSIFKVTRDDRIYLWEPFSERYNGAYKSTRNIYKNKAGNKILFEEVNEDLELAFRYLWTFSDQFGFVKKSSLTNTSVKKVFVEILDGIQNILPYGVSSDLQNRRSTLVDAYKKNELDQDSGIGIFSLSAMIVDKPEPSEALLATVAYSVGLPSEKFLLSSVQLSAFRKGEDIVSEEDIRAERGAFFIHSQQEVSPSAVATWFIVSDVNQTMKNILNLSGLLNDRSKFQSTLGKDIQDGTEKLLARVGMADGIQLSKDKLSTGRHFSNVLFNIMRGGVFKDQYEVYTDDLKDYFSIINKQVSEEQSGYLESLGDKTTYQNLVRKAVEAENIDLLRICYEYLPLSFSRRHGDPSRPWNTFSIELKDEFGKKNKTYEGNWRDIFQNWEALSLAYPEYVEGMIIKFVNASTIDGYNPYRITREGIDWEVIEPNDPWSFIGYWGDHQIIYLLKLLEISHNHHPGILEDLLTKDIFVYANVPYRIKSYAEILNNPKDTIDFDHELAAIIDQRVNITGADGKVVWDSNNQILRANLMEKLLVMVLTKLYNFIPDAGIWLNTQRPEWNDANNALVGNGTSMVTLYYLVRFLKFSIKFFGNLEEKEIELNQPVSQLLETLNQIFNSHELPDGKFSDSQRKSIMDELGIAGEKYRIEAYKGFNGKRDKVNASRIIKFLEKALSYSLQSIKTNKRPDGLYHAYNLIEINEDSVEVNYLYEMLEGQVAVLSAGTLKADEAVSVMDALKRSKIYREDQYSYMLYPDRELPLFVNRNNIPKEFVNNSKLIKQLESDGDNTLVERDTDGNYHFNGSFHNADDLRAQLDIISKHGYKDLVEVEYNNFLDAFEDVFNHKSFTGRSGTFYGYEGLGSIYWHMVSKLLLATQENIQYAQESE
ncbi:MAG: hypothetical protein ABFS32_21155, partial [Bacteroidota bacterium]